MKLDKLYKALCIFNQHFDLSKELVSAEHDEIHLMDLENRVLPKEVMEELEDLGFVYDEEFDCFTCFT